MKYTTLIFVYKPHFDCTSYVCINSLTTHLYVLLYANQALFEGVEAGGVEHLLLDLGRVRTPGHEKELLLLGFLGGALALVLVLEVEESVATVVRAAARQIGQEHVVRLVPVTWKYFNEIVISHFSSLTT